MSVKLMKWGGAVAFTGTLQADAGLLLAQRTCDASDPGGSTAEFIWYQVGDASGREGEVWCFENGGAGTKLGDWLLPNNDTSSDIYIRFSDISGDSPSGELKDTWLQIGGSGSTNRNMQLSTAPPGSVSGVFSVELSLNASTVGDGPDNWSLSADAS